jgi:hypothetical protein
VTVAAAGDPAIIDGPFTFVTSSSVTVTFAAENTESWAIYKIEGQLLDSGNGSFGDAYDSGLSPNTNYLYVIRLYPELNQTGEYVPVFIDATTSASGTTTTTTTTTSGPSEYTITWSANGGSVTPTSTTVSAGNSLTVPTPTKADNQFWKWRYPSAGDLIETLDAGQTYVPTTSRTFTAVWEAYAAPVNTATPSVTPSTGEAGSQQFSCTTGTWTGTPTPTYTYQWKFNDQGSLWVGISGATSSTYTPLSNYVSVYGSGLRCYVTATNAAGDSTVYAPSVTVTAPSGTTTTAATTTAATTTAATTTTTSGTTSTPACTPGAICDVQTDPQGCLDFYVYDSNCNCVFESKYC